MDYHAYNDDYGLLMLNFPKITLVLLDKLNALKAAGFQSDQAYLFGFSFGARLITSAGVLFGDRELQRGDSKYTECISFSVNTNISYFPGKCVSQLDQASS